MDPHSFYLLGPDPDPGGKIFQNTKKGKEIANNCNFIQFFKVNFHKAPLFLILE